MINDPIIIYDIGVPPSNCIKKKHSIKLSLQMLIIDTLYSFFNDTYFIKGIVNGALCY